MLLFQTENGSPSDFPKSVSANVPIYAVKVPVPNGIDDQDRLVC
jgi:hypothetical protein